MTFMKSDDEKRFWAHLLNKPLFNFMMALLGMTAAYFTTIGSIKVQLAEKAESVLVEGIDKKYECPEPVEENVYEMAEKERQRRGIGSLPADLLQAINLTEKSKVVRKALGDHVFDAFIENKKIEWDQYRVQVSEYELNKYHL